jgi:hypothetical protein
MNSKESELHGLVNNGGIMAVPHALSKDGFECQFAVRLSATQLLQVTTTDFVNAVRQITSLIGSLPIY